MRLSETKVCINCDEVFEEGFTCPKCDSKVIMFLGSWIRPMVSVESRLSEKELGKITGGYVRGI